MGEDFISKQREGFQHRCDLARRGELLELNLFSFLREGRSRRYRCRRVETGERISVGDVLLLKPAADGGIEVLKGNQVLGSMSQSGSARLGPALSACRAPVLPAVVCSVSELGGAFEVTPEDCQPE